MAGHVAPLIVGPLVAVLITVQGTPGRVAGTVTDSDRGVIPGATITIEAQGATRKTVTNTLGRYAIDDLPPGRYDIRASLDGFITEMNDALVVAAGRTTTWDATLTLALNRARLSPRGADPTDPLVARSVYAAVLDVIFRDTHVNGARPGLIAVEPASALAPPWSGTWPDELRDVPAELQQAMSASEHRQPVWLSQSAMPSDARVLRRTDPLPTVHEAFSRVFVTADGLDAVVYYEHSCGSLCGEGTILWFVRRTPTDAWILRARHVCWVS